ncbi:MAG TPA: hypothetical protein VME20_05640 [Acidimicrobiales bacterium]|nr:hypothetical protein [Acidimicrobiales bacterium]
MATQHPRYEVPWQVSSLLGYDYGAHGARMAKRRVDAASKARAERCEALARFAGLLAGSDITAIVSCQNDHMTVEVVDPLTPWLVPGTVLEADEPPAPAGRGVLASLLGGRQAWVECAPPLGFRSAALLSVPYMAASKSLVLVTSFCEDFDKRSLGLAALYLAHAPHSSRLSEDAHLRRGAA